MTPKQTITLKLVHAPSSSAFTLEILESATFTPDAGVDGAAGGTVLLVGRRSPDPTQAVGATMLTSTTPDGHWENGAGQRYVEIGRGEAPAPQDQELDQDQQSTPLHGSGPTPPRKFIVNVTLPGGEYLHDYVLPEDVVLHLCVPGMAQDPAQLRQAEDMVIAGLQAAYRQIQERWDMERQAKSQDGSHPRLTPWVAKQILAQGFPFVVTDSCTRWVLEKHTSYERAIHAAADRVSSIVVVLDEFLDGPGFWKEAQP